MYKKGALKRNSVSCLELFILACNSNIGQNIPMSKKPQLQENMLNTINPVKLLFYQNLFIIINYDYA